MKIKYMASPASPAISVAIANWLIKQNEVTITSLILKTHYTAPQYAKIMKQDSRTIWFYIDAPEDIIMEFMLKFGGPDTEIRYGDDLRYGRDNEVYHRYPALDREQILNAEDIDVKLGTKNWTVRVDGDYGDVGRVHVRWWLPDTDLLLPRGGEAAFRVITRGTHDSYARSMGDVFTTGLVIELLTFHRVGNYPDN